MERSITLSFFVEASLSLLSFLLLVCLFFNYGNTEKQATLIDGSRMFAFEVSQ